MGRSVSYASGSEVVLYSYFEYDEEDYFIQDAFDDCVDCLQSSLIKSFPSMYESDEWIGREDRAIAENRLVYVGLSEYCGVVSVWVKPKEDDYRPYVQEFGVRFANQIESKLKEIVKNVFGIRLNKTATFSNGEAIFSEVK